MKVNNYIDELINILGIAAMILLLWSGLEYAMLRQITFNTVDVLY